jgi:hypothetical protein
MTRRPDFKRLPPPLQRLGAQLADLEAAEERAAVGTRWRPVSISVAGALLAVLVALIVILDTGGRAGADIINRAVAAAVASEFVRYRSTISIDVGARQLDGFTQTGEIDFPRRAYATTLELGGGGVIEQRRVGGVLYVAQLATGHSQSSSVRWLAIPVAHEASSTFASGPESQEFTNPLALLDELAGTHAPVKTLGPARLAGVVSTRYRLRTNLAALLSASPNAGRQPASYRAIPVTLIVWLDSRGRPRRVQETVAGTAAIGAASIKTVTDFSAYAQPVTVLAPSNVVVRSKHSIVAPNPLSASPGRLYERLLLAPRHARSCSQAARVNCRRVPNP